MLEACVISPFTSTPACISHADGDDVDEANSADDHTVDIHDDEPCVLLGRPSTDKKNDGKKFGTSTATFPPPSPSLRDSKDASAPMTTSTSQESSSSILPVVLPHPRDPHPPEHDRPHADAARVDEANSSIPEASAAPLEGKEADAKSWMMGLMGGPGDCCVMRKDDGEGIHVVSLSTVCSTSLSTCLMHIRSWI